MAKSDRPTRQRSWPLLYSISFLKPRLWVSLAECCNIFFFIYHSCNQTVTLLHVEGGGGGRGGLQGLVGAHKVGLIKHTHPSSYSCRSPPNTVQDIERYLGAAGVTYTTICIVNGCNPPLKQACFNVRTCEIRFVSLFHSQGTEFSDWFALRRRFQI